MKDKKYVIGISIIIVTFLVSLNPYILIFTVPIFLIGVVLIWVSKVNLITKTLWTILPVMLWYPSFFLLIYLNGIIRTATAQKLDFNFPENFKGKAIVIHQSNCGQEILKKDGREQLNFPNNGILLYRGKIESGYINHQYYYVSAQGEKRKIPERADYMFSENIQLSSSEIGVWFAGMGKATAFPAEVFSDYVFLELIVSSKDSLAKYSDFRYIKQVDSLKSEIVKSCR